VPDHEKVYVERALRYDELISYEDANGAIPRAISDIVDHAGLDVVDLGAGTGRLASLLAREARSVILIDGWGRMLDTAAVKMHRAGFENWTIRVSDLRRLPLPDGSADLIVSGWSICFVASSNQPDHRDDLRAVVNEIERVLRPGGTAIIFETLGTGSPKPRPPDSLVPYFAALEGEYGFEHRWIRTDYAFASPEEARDLSAFFFGREMPSKLIGPDRTDLPGCTGVWWRRF
jgi:ubiquinone/menaquinone biosynthesis C-methylase UbiE